MSVQGHGALPGIHRDLRRANALVRDERRLTEALARLDAERAGADAFAELLDRTVDLVETMGQLCDDDHFWGRLAHAHAEPLTSAQVEALRDFTTAPLADLLVLAGYRSPPPPHVDELVGDTIGALERALERGLDARYEPGATVESARSMLASMLFRIRRQVSIAEAQGPPATGRLARAGIRAAELSRIAIPLASGVAAGATVELFAPTTGIGFVVGKVAADLIERPTQWLAEVAIERLVRSQDNLDDDGTEHDAYEAGFGGVGQPILVHTIGLVDALSTAERMSATHDPEGLDRSLTRARRHLDRVSELASDAATHPDGLLSLTRLIDRLTTETEVETGLISEALETARQVQDSVLDLLDHHQIEPFGP